MPSGRSLLRSGWCLSEISPLRRVAKEDECSFEKWNLRDPTLLEPREVEVSTENVGVPKPSADVGKESSASPGRTASHSAT